MVFEYRQDKVETCPAPREGRDPAPRSTYTAPTTMMPVPGAACSEVFSGPALAKVLRPAVELQQKALEALEKGEAWEPLSIHTSAGEVAWVSMRIDIR